MNVRLINKEFATTGIITAIKEGVPSGLRELYNQPVVTMFQIAKTKNESAKIAHPFRLIFENFEISCANNNKGTNATKIKKGVP